jgi:hypothetical protein
MAAMRFLKFLKVFHAVSDAISGTHDVPQGASLTTKESEDAQKFQLGLSKMHEDFWQRRCTFKDSAIEIFTCRTSPIGAHPERPQISSGYGIISIGLHIH